MQLPKININYKKSYLQIFNRMAVFKFQKTRMKSLVVENYFSKVTGLHAAILLKQDPYI